MKGLRFAFLVAALAVASAPTAAQTGLNGVDFVNAVRSRDGNKATELLESHPTGLVDTRDGDGSTGLIIAVSRQDEDWTAFLINHGADPNLPGKGGDTPLIAASRIGFEQGAEWLLESGAKVDLANRMGETALIVAVQQRRLPIVRMLLGAGANPDKTDSAAGLSARDYATRDSRARDILNLIQASKPKPAAAPSGR
jgi:ankyrin repeat protein